MFETFFKYNRTLKKLNVFGFSELTEIMMQRKDQNSTRTGDDLDLSDEEEDLFEDPLEEIPIKHQVCMFTTGNASATKQRMATRPHQG